MISEGQMDAIVTFESQHPSAALGPHLLKKNTEVIAYLPIAVEATLLFQGQRVRLIEIRDKIFRALLPGSVRGDAYTVEFSDSSGYVHTRHDPYAFPPSISDDDLFLFKKGELHYSYRTLGAHPMERDGVHGVVFRVWAPNAKAISIVGNFNHWYTGFHPMTNVQDSGIWELFIPDLGNGELYKFAIKSKKDNRVRLKVDPYAFRAQLRPETASLVDFGEYQWGDSEWMQKRETDLSRRPLAVYEVHSASWRKEDGKFMNYRDLATQLSEYCKDLGFNYVELMPVMEHPLDDSWGYQVTSYYAPSSRNGTPEDFKFFVDTMHSHGIGVILDWVPAHFPSDDFGLSMYDGTHLYEHEDPRRGSHPDWGTLIFNYARNEVRNFLISNAIFWVNEYHADGLRVDAVSSMLYLDYSRKAGQWLPNQYGGNENLEAIAFIKEFTGLIRSEFPGVITVAEESTAWAGVTNRTSNFGLGFDFKWNMGWMHDTLLYFSRDPIHRRFHQGELSFSMVYAYSENFILPLSHDEVVHRKGSLYGKMPGDDWQKRANLRLCYAYMFTFPGKKLLFMGSEFGQWSEWNFSTQLQWDHAGTIEGSGTTALVKDLNSLYFSRPCLYEGDCNSSGFEWIDFSDSDNSVISYIRYSRDRKQFAVCVFNFTPEPRTDYRVGVPESGYYREVMNSDSRYYGGSDMGNLGGVTADALGKHGRRFSVALTLPPLAGIVLVREQRDAN